MGPWLFQTSLPQGTGPPGYPKCRFHQIMGPLAIPDVVTSRNWDPWLSQTSLPPCTGPPGFPRRRYLLVLGPLAIPDVVPSGTGPPGYPRRRYLQVLGPLAILDVVSSRYWVPWFSPDVVTSRYCVPWLSQTSFRPGTVRPGYPRRRYFQVMGPLAFPEAVPSRY